MKELVNFEREKHLELNYFYFEKSFRLKSFNFFLDLVYFSFFVLRLHFQTLVLSFEIKYTDVSSITLNFNCPPGWLVYRLLYCLLYRLHTPP